MTTIIESIERRQLRRVPRFAPGDRVRVHFEVVEGTRRRTQVFEGVVIARQGSGSRETFTVRKQSFGVGVERTFPVHSPKIERLEVVARGDVRRAKLYYLRGRIGKRARVAERRWGIEDDLVGEEPGAIDLEGESQEEVEPEVVAEEGEADEASDADEADAEAPADEQPEAAPDEEASEGEEPEAGTSVDERLEPETQAGDEPEPSGEPAAEAEGSEEEPSEERAEAEGSTEEPPRP